MANAPYNYIKQPMVATALIQQSDSDGFYFPGNNGHTGYAFNGQHYTNGVQDIGYPSASWFSEGSGSYRGAGTSFPFYGLILLGRASMTILDESNPSLNLWMTFLFGNGMMLTDNFIMGDPNFSTSYQMGFTPSGLSYANGKLSVVLSPDRGSESITSTMAITIDFSQDRAYLDVAV